MEVVIKIIEVVGVELLLIVIAEFVVIVDIIITIIIIIIVPKIRGKVDDRPYRRRPRERISNTRESKQKTGGNKCSTDRIDTFSGK